LYSMYGPASVIRVLATLPLLILPLVYWMGEVRHAPVASPRQQCGEIWNTVCSRAVWQPMGFVYLYNVMQVSNSAWKEYLVTVHHFTSCQLNILLIVSFALLFCGILMYKYFLILWSWRKVYITTTLLNGFFSVLQILLIYGITFGLSPFLFTLGDDAFAEFIAGIQFLPTTIMMVHLCPLGSEGASYAMFTTVNNSALTMSSAISTQLLKIWDVCRQTLAAGHFRGMINLSYLTTASQVAAILFVGLLPRYKEDLMELGNSALSKVGGFIFLLITFSTIVYAVTVGVSNIVYPDWTWFPSNHTSECS
jgi:BT1 family